LTLTLSEIVNYTTRIDDEAKALVKEILRIAWQMRGGINLNEAYMLTHEDREIITDIIKENMKITKDSGMAFI
jgi:hypothetical protein